MLKQAFCNPQVAILNTSRVDYKIDTIENQ